MTDETIEQEIQTKDLTAPRVTLGDIGAEIASEHYFTGRDAAIGQHSTEGGVVAMMYPNTVENGRRAAEALSMLTFCVLVLRNGFKVVGINYGSVDPTGFDTDFGRKDAREDAIRQIWPLLGFRLRDELSRGALTDAAAAADLAGTPRPS